MSSEFSDKDVFDSRDVDSRIEELQDELDSINSSNEEEKERINEENEEHKEECRLYNEEHMNDEDFVPKEYEPEVFEPDEFDEQEELDTLIEFKESVNSSSWKYGMTFISEDYFEDYAREFAEDIGAISGNESWPCNYIDWEAAANALKMDYGCVTLDGTDFYYND